MENRLKKQQSTSSPCGHRQMIAQARPNTEDHAKLKCTSISKVLVLSEFVKGSSGKLVFGLVDVFSIASSYFGTTSSMPVSCAYISMQQLAAPRGRGDFSRFQILGVHSPTLGGLLTQKTNNLFSDTASGCRKFIVFTIELQP